MNLIHAIVLGFTEGVTEFLPISSTGHLILVSYLLKIAQTDFVKTFEIFIQSGSILAVVVFYWKTIMTKKSFLKKVLAGFIPTGIIGFILYKVIKHYLLGNTSVVLWSLLLGGIAIIAIELYLKQKEKKGKNEKDDKSSIVNRQSHLSSVSYKQAIIVGIIQSFSVIPGVSRSAATIFGGIATGMDRATAVEFSFLLAIPTMLAATGLDLSKSSFHFSTNEWLLLLVGFATSFAVALLVIKWLTGYVKKYSFIPFGIYRIGLAIVYFLLFIK